MRRPIQPMLAAAVAALMAGCSPSPSASPPPSSAGTAVGPDADDPPAPGSAEMPGSTPADGEASTGSGAGGSAPSSPSTVRPPATSSAPPTNAPSNRSATIGSPREELMVRGLVGVAEPGAITLAEVVSGIAVVAIDQSTEYRLAEGEPASFEEVESGAIIAATGTPDGDRLAARVIILLDG